MKILLKIISINFFSIAGTLKRYGRLDYYKQICARDCSYITGDNDSTKKEYDAFTLSIVGKFGIPRNKLDENCRVITNY